MARQKTEVESVEPEVTAAVEDLENEVIVETEVAEEDAIVDADETEEFVQFTEIGDDEDEVSDDEISEDM